jgi:catechol 2,3-dioxygenase-like lactoylglutathione lyase family enzyme
VDPSPSPPLGLGELVLRVRDLDGMQRFYQEVFGLELLRRFERMAFLRVADGRAGHTTIVALFDQGLPSPIAPLPRTSTDVPRTTLHHFALEIPLADHAAWKARLEAHGLAVTTAEHVWVRWRSLYVADPEGNVVELVCHDPSLGPP